MKLLDKNRYGELMEPLAKISINTLFARSVIEHKVTGKVFVDDTDNPKTFYVVHPYGMSLLFGDSSVETFNSTFRNYALNTFHIRDNHEWMQAFPDSWDNVLKELFRGVLVNAADNAIQNETNIIELNTRVNFKFNEDKFLLYKKENVDSDLKIVRTDREVFRNMPGAVVPFYFWKTEDDFLYNGVGFSLFYKGKLASTAYSSCIHGNQLELGIETVEEFRGKGFAKFTCTALIDYCIENNYEPVWACRRENEGSYKLAQKLGFTSFLELPYYRLGK